MAMLGVCARQRENKRGITLSEPHSISFTPKQTLVAVCPALKGFFFFFPVTAADVVK